MSFTLLLILDHFGKPTAQKISGNETCRNWDPTDSNPNNPWNTYSEVSQEQEDEQNNSNDIVIEVENNEIYNNYLENI